MKSLFKKVLLLSLVQLSLLGSVFANSNIDLIENGPSFVLPSETNVLVRAFVFNVDNSFAGIEQSVVNQDGTVTNTIVIGDGAVVVKYPGNRNLLTVLPIDSSIATAFPDVAQFVGQPGYAVLLQTGNNRKTDPNTTFSGIGSLKKIDSVFVRCTHLLKDGKIIRCLQCNLLLTDSDNH